MENLEYATVQKDMRYASNTTQQSQITLQPDQEKRIYKKFNTVSPSVKSAKRAEPCVVFTNISISFGFFLLRNAKVVLAAN